MREDRFKWREGDITITRSAGQPLTAEEEELAAFFRLWPSASKADPQRFSWRGKLAQLWNATVGKLVPRLQVNRWVEASIAAVPVGEWAKQLMAGTLDVGTWQDQFRGEIKREYIRQYLLGRGGIENMTPADWGSIGGSIAEQYRWLDNFAREVATGDLSEGQIRRRSEMYINSAREAFERAKERAAREAEQNEVWWKRDRNAENCEDCKEFDEMGWVPVDPWPYVLEGKNTRPGQGDTTCLTSCKCGLIYRKRRHIAKKGGPGSGHHGHAGRPGKRGGSLPGRTGTVGTNSDAQARVLIHNMTLDDQVTNREFASSEIGRYMAVMPERFSASSGMRSVYVCENAEDMYDHLKQYAPHEAAGVDPESLRGFYDRNRGHAGITLWISEDLVSDGYSGRNFYHEYAHSLDSWITSDGWEAAWAEWDGSQDEAFTDAFSEYMVASLSSDPDEMAWYREYRTRSWQLFSGEL